MKHLLLLLICGGLLCSCTITKRHFGNGYHVEWNRKTGKNNSERECAKLQPVENNQLFESVNAMDSSSPVLNDVTEPEHEQVFNNVSIKQTAANDSQDQPTVQFKKVQVVEKPIETAQKESDKEDEEEPKSGMHPLMWGIWAMWSVAIVCMFFVTFYVEALIGVSLGFFIALIFALIVLRSMRKHPVKQPFKGLSYGFGIPAIVFGVIASAGLGLILVILLT